MRPLQCRWVLAAGVLLMACRQFYVAAAQGASKIPFFGLLPKHKLRALEPEADDNANDIYYYVRPEPDDIPDGFELHYPNYRFVFDVPKDPENPVYVITKKGQALELLEHHGHHHHHGHGKGKKHQHDKDEAAEISETKTTVASETTGVSTTASSILSAIAPSKKTKTVAPSIVTTTPEAPSGSAITLGVLTTKSPEVFANSQEPTKKPTVPTQAVTSVSIAKQSEVSTVSALTPPPPRPSIFPFRPSISRGPTSRPTPTFRPYRPFGPVRPPFVVSGRNRISPVRSYSTVAPPRRPISKPQQLRPTQPPFTEKPATTAPPLPSVVEKLKLNLRDFPADQYRHFPGGFVRLSTFSSNSG